MFQLKKNSIMSYIYKFYDLNNVVFKKHAMDPIDMHDSVQKIEFFVYLSI